MTHETFRELLPLYVIGALDGEELRQFEQYVAENRARCAAEISEFQNVADQIALAAPPAAPSADVFERVLAAIEQPQRAAASVPVRERRESEGFDFGVLLMRWIPWAAAAVLCVLSIVTTNRLRDMTNRFRELQQQNSAQGAQISKLDAQSRELRAQLDLQRTDLTTLRAANEHLLSENRALMAEKEDLARVANGLRQELSRQSQQVATLENTVNEQQQRLALVMDPAIRVATLADPKAASKAAAKVYWQEATKSGLIVVSNVEPVLKGQGKSLELWAICGDKPPAPAGIFWTDASGHGSREVKLMGDLACVDKFAVSVEATDNVPLPSPKGSIVLVGQ